MENFVYITDHEFERSEKWCSKPGCGYPDGRPCIGCGRIITAETEFKEPKITEINGVWFVDQPDRSVMKIRQFGPYQTDRQARIKFNELQPPLSPQQAPSFSNRACVDCGEWSASGGSRCEDCQEENDMP